MSLTTHMCLVERMDKWKDGKLICLVEKKNEKMENSVYINLPLCPYWINQRVTYYIFIKKIVYK